MGCTMLSTSTSLPPPLLRSSARISRYHNSQWRDTITTTITIITLTTLTTAVVYLLFQLTLTPIRCLARTRTKMKIHTVTACPNGQGPTHRCLPRPRRPPFRTILCRPHQTTLRSLHQPTRLVCALSAYMTCIYRVSATSHCSTRQLLRLWNLKRTGKRHTILCTLSNHTVLAESLKSCQEQTARKENSRCHSYPKWLFRIY